jgi:hypothetical protein
LLCIVIPIATAAQATRNSGRAFAEYRGSRDEPNAIAALTYSKKIMISDTKTRRDLTQLESLHHPIWRCS